MRSCAGTTSLLTLAILGCATRDPRGPVAEELAARSGYAMQLESLSDDDPSLPPGVSVGDGLDADEAGAIALWNSPALRAELTRVATAQAELEGARRPSNPNLRMLAPANPMQFYVWFAWPLEAFVTMPRRKRLAKANLDAVAGQTVQTGLDLVRDVRMAHVDWVLAHDRLRVRQQLASGLDEVAKIAEARAAAGDMPPSDADAARGDALVAVDEVARSEADVAIASARLFALLGWRPEGKLDPVAGDPLRARIAGDSDWTTVALASRPDLRSAEHTLEAAGARVGLEKLAILRLSGIVYSTSGGGGPTGVQGGGEVSLPIFDQNQAGVGRAEAELEAAAWRYQDVRNRVVAEVTEGELRLEQASRSLERYRETIVAVRQLELTAATASFDLGEQTYVPVLVSAGRLETAKLREVELAADMRRATALLERAVGRRIQPGGASEGARTQ